MRGSRLCRVAAAGGGAVLLAALALSTLQHPLPTTAYVSQPGARVLIEDAPPACSIGFCYTPADLSIANGATVTWLNNTATTHTVTRCTPAACAGNGPGDGRDGLTDSGPFANGANYFFTFRSPGRYLYYCTLYGYKVMHGSVTVNDTGPQATPTPARPFGVPLPQTPPLPPIPVPLPGVGAGHPPGNAPATHRF